MAVLRQQSRAVRLAVVAVLFALVVPAVAASAPGRGGPTPGPGGGRGGAKPSTGGFLAALMGKIKHIVVLMEENRSFDHFFGFAAKRLGVNGLKGDEFNLVNVSNPAQGKIRVGTNARYVNPCDPSRGTPPTATKIKDNMAGFVSYENGIGHGTKQLNYCDVMSSFAPSELPIVTTLAEEYAIMDRMFCSHAGPTWPNRMFALSATSLGSTETGCFYNNTPGKLFPQRTFFDQVTEAGLTWKNYYNDTPWELFLATIAHNPEHVRPLTEFYQDAARGSLPSYSWINPRAGMNVTTGEGSNDQHPDHDVALGEALIKDVYESLRASPAWNETLFIITYDEHGGFYDHVTPPHGPPPGDVEGPSYPDPGYDFAQLGVRIPTLLVSPWISKGTVLSAAPQSQRPAQDSEYDLTSIMATSRKLLGMPLTPLTKRDAWAATFEHVLSRDEPRTDCPGHLPAAPAKTLHHRDEAALPINDLQRDIGTVHAHVVGGAGAAASAAYLAGNKTATQGAVSEWLQGRYAVHAANTLAWKASKQAGDLTVMTRPANMAGWEGGLFQISFEEGATVQTINAATAKGAVGAAATLRCLDWRGGQGASAAGYSNCYPSAAPSTNRDPDQQWVAKNDATIRPAQDERLCLTNVRMAPTSRWEVYNVSVAACDGQVGQHWAVGTQRDGIASLSFATEVAVGLV